MTGLVQSLETVEGSGNGVALVEASRRYRRADLMAER